MRKILLVVAILFLSFYSLISQVDERITTLDFVQILNGNRAEAVHYYEHNWKALRVKAAKLGYIHSFELLETPITESEPFHFILITTYKNGEQYEKREEHFGKLIEERGSQKLLNEKKPDDFRKILFYKEGVRHWKSGD